MKEHRLISCIHGDEYCDNSDQSCVLSTCTVCKGTDSVPGEFLPAVCPERELTEYERKTGHVESTYCSCDGAGICAGCNLFICKICGGAESSLPTHCPGRKMTEVEGDEVTMGERDYKNDVWMFKKES